MHKLAFSHFLFSFEEDSLYLINNYGNLLNTITNSTLEETFLETLNRLKPTLEIDEEFHFSLETDQHIFTIFIQKNQKAGNYDGYIFESSSLHLLLKNTKISSRKLLIYSHLKEALEQEEFHLVFQPIIDVSKNSIVGAEALLRWKGSKIGNITASELIPILEESEYIHPIGYWIIKKACKEMKKWHLKTKLNLELHINISSNQLKAANFGTTFLSILKEEQLDPTLFTLEITEHSFMELDENILNNIHLLSQNGVSFAIDDFGTGYSNFNNLNQLPISTIKIDKSFIMNALDSEKNIEIIDIMISLSKKLKIDVVAEGVETKEILQLLRNHNCSLIQGYYFSKPLHSSVFLDYIERNQVS
ncbi:putative bifunctional diguanylate cyclase/phosphodiesterase [Metabacillus fastidiosus]|uniref:EAL domain-containing protein n=1 Tax=Metabacillus fastidiosus TaxID=1458 RepID=A0ABU6P6D5_9BACI|nr:EAL domain-containing protein [Metabacillus fastidiosus]MED4404094.1 EAL domain-containing protein [Metabacillus fastidiosus]